MYQLIGQGNKIALLSSSVRIDSPSAALELAVNIVHEAGTGDLAIPKECFPPEFFILSTGLAGEILQKWTNYQIRAAIFGDFSQHTSTSKPLRDFIFESNKRGKNVFFVEDQEQAVQRVSGGAL